MKQHHVQGFYAEQVEHINIEKSIEEVKDGNKIDRIVEKEGKSTNTLSQQKVEDSTAINTDVHYGLSE